MALMGIGEVQHENQNPLLLSSPEENETQEESSKHDDTFISKTWKESMKLWQIAGPSIFSRLAMFSMIVITQSFAGHLSELNLAAISIATTVIIAISFGFLVTKNQNFLQFHFK